MSRRPSEYQKMKAGYQKGLREGKRIILVDNPHTKLQYVVKVVPSRFHAGFDGVVYAPNIGEIACSNGHATPEEALRAGVAEAKKNPF